MSTPFKMKGSPYKVFGKNISYKGSKFKKDYKRGGDGKLGQGMANMKAKYRSIRGQNQ